MENIKHFHQPIISETLSNGWYTMKKYFLWLFLAVIISAIVDGPSAGMQMNFDNDSGWNIWENIEWAAPMIGLAIILGLIGLAVFLFIKPVIQFGADMMFVQAVRDTEPDIKTLFRGFKENYVNIILAHLLYVAILAIGFVCLIIPGIIFACRLAFVSYLVMDKGLDPIRAIETSWRMTEGYGWTIFGLGLLAIPIFIGGLICFIVGVFPALIWINANFASMYQAILTEKENNPVSPHYR